MAVAKLKKTPVMQWIEGAMLHSGMSQSELARALQTRLQTEFDRSKIYKILKGGRKVTAEEMLAIEEVTAFPAPATLHQAPAAVTKAVKVLNVPLLDAVTVGKLRNLSLQIPAEGVPQMAFAGLGRGDFFALQVADDDDSMDRISPPGSVIVVNRAERDLKSGRCYVFSIEGVTSYKMWQDGDPAYLASSSTNPTHKPLFMRRKRNFDVIGRVKRTVLDL
jgi:phage repressor protein C with HTH and peptisase S24 domain